MKTIDQYQKELEELRKVYKKIGKQIIFKVNKIRAFQEKADNNLTLDDVEQLLEVYPETDAKYKLLEKLLEKYNLSFYGYYSDTNQRAISIGNYETLDIDKTIQGLQFILPYLKPIKDGKIHISIKEPTLSEFGVYTLLISKDLFEIQRMIYHCPSILAKFKTLKEALIYINNTLFKKES